MQLKNLKLLTLEPLRCFRYYVGSCYYWQSDIIDANWMSIMYYHHLWPLQRPTEVVQVYEHYPACHI
jgi:hypothetical protein